MEVLDHGFVKLVGQTGHVGLSIVNAARCSYGRASEEYDDADRKLVGFLMQHGHTSPFRHAFFTFHVKAPLFVFRQWWKYQVGSTWREYEVDGLPVFHHDEQIFERVDIFDIQIDTDQGCSWNELSGRYKVMDPEFYVPARARRNTGKQASEAYPGERTDEDELMRSMMMAANDNAMRYYTALLRDGIAKELARLVLPPSIYSECFWTVSLQAVIHFLQQRLAKDAQFEIREYAQAVRELLRPVWEQLGLLPEGNA
jgi:thymidylate synthase (FAD)